MLTTNYDTLLEQRLNVPSVDRSSLPNFQRVISGGAKGVVHLHGVWDKPETIVFSSDQYAKLSFDECQSALQRAVASTKSILYIGFGAGMGDPNFSDLLSWHRRLFSVSGVEHFRLCLDDELPDLRSAHVDSHISPISYGTKYSEFPQFIKGLISGADLSVTNEAGIVRDIPRETRVQMIAELQIDTRLIDSTYSETCDEVNSVALPPILLPVPHAEYIERGADSDDARTKRLDPDVECAQDGVVIIVGDEHCGLTTALKWLVIRASELDYEKTPIYVDFNNRQSGTGPFERLVRQEALERGIIQFKHDNLPRVALALDNYSPHVRKISDNVLRGIAQSEIETIFIGCRSNDEAEIVERLSNIGVNAQVRYVGRLNMADVTALAKIAAPTVHRSITQRIVSVLRAERLPRNPFTVSLLITILLRGEEVAAEASPTGILEQYIGLLLGRGDPTVDTRYSIGTEQSITALSALAEVFARKASSVLSESVTVEVLAGLISDYAWPETATDMMRKFRESRILSVNPSGVSFVRSSYLHLFAAKYALREPEFLRFILDDPLRFGPVIRHYAALSRRDVSIIEAMQNLLDEFADEGSASKIYDIVKREDAPDDFLKELEGDESESGSRELVPLDEPPDPLDSISDSDRNPFPEIDDHGIPGAQRYALALETASTALRDLDEVKELDKKKRLLETVIQGWGTLAGILSEESAFIDLQKSIISSIREREPEFSEKHSELLAELFNVIPCAYVASGIERSLSSRKLLKILNELLLEGRLSGGAHSASATALLMMSIGGNGWVSGVEKVLRGKEDVWIYRNFIAYLFYALYLNDEVDRGEEVDLIRFVAVSIVDRWKYKDDRKRKLAIGVMQQRLKREKVGYQKGVGKLLW
ncbi:SIR2 family protein [Rhodococcus aetherivorans]